MVIRRAVQKKGRGDSAKRFQEIKRKIKKTFVDKAKKIREYRKLLEKEGVPALSLRPYSGEDGEGVLIQSQRFSKSTQPIPTSETGFRRRKLSHKKTNPFHSAEETFLEQQMLKEEKQRLRAENERRKAELLKQRAEKSKKLRARTRRGQPIMKYEVENLLDKLKKQS